MSQNTFQIPTAAEVAAEVVAMLLAKELVVPSGALDIDAAAAWLKCSPKHLRALVELNKIQARNISAGTGEKSTLRFSIRELDKFLTGG